MEEKENEGGGGIELSFLGGLVTATAKCITSLPSISGRGGEGPSSLVFVGWWRRGKGKVCYLVEEEEGGREWVDSESWVGMKKAGVKRHEQKWNNV